ncbi:hypothetical protein TKK_0016035 [Trichogramma kaykai]|uniref:Adipocyte plasma membrane-associated protein n=1 Tax=Trichogramma kaykai TaxID=54128 RepID=A0ABD2W996_9HYME
MYTTSEICLHKLKSPKILAVFAILLTVIVGLIIYLIVSSGKDIIIDLPSSTSTKLPPVLQKSGLVAINEAGLFFKLEPESGKYEPLSDKKFFNVTAFDIYRNETIFYGTSGIEPIRSIYKRYDKIGNLTKDWTKTALAIDQRNGDLYVLDNKQYVIHVINVNGSQMSRDIKILKTAKEPLKDLKIDIQNNFIFVLSKKSVQMFHMNGTVLNKYSLRKSIGSMTVDSVNMVFFVTTSCGIISQHYMDEINRVNVLNHRNTVVRQIVFTRDENWNEILYWINDDHSTREKSFKKCQLIHSRCNEITKIDSDDDIATSMFITKWYHFAYDAGISF